MGRLDGKVAIITGGGMGMGRASAILFAREGAKVTVADIDTEAGEQTVRTIKESGGEAIFVKTDVSKSKDCASMVKATVDAFGKLDIIYNNAGILEPEYVPLHECKEEDFDKVIAVNLKGVFLGMKYAIPEMLKAGGGSIINQASAVCSIGIPKHPSYAPAKGGVVTMSMSAAMDYVRDNIRINWITPGTVSTPMVEQAFPNREDYDRLQKWQALGRFGTPEEIANVALFLASDESSYITSTEMKADGGCTQGYRFNAPAE